MPPVGFEPTISAGERLQTYALDRVATGTGELPCYRDYSRDNRKQDEVHDMKDKGKGHPRTGHESPEGE